MRTRNSMSIRTPSHSRAIDFQTGRMFVGPLFDYLAIGGGLSILVIIVAWMFSGRSSVDQLIFTPVLLLLSNYAHFAASTVRLYTKPRAFEMVPFLTMGFPAVTILTLTLGIVFAEQIGVHLVRLYLTWSPFHYSAQAYGICLIYLYRSGWALTPLQKRLLWLACMCTFFKTFISQTSLRSGIWWLLPPSILESSPDALLAMNVCSSILDVAALTAPLILFGWLSFVGRARIPVISLLVVLANAAWFSLFPLMDAVTAVTIFHGIQYIAIVTVFHVRDQMRTPNNRFGARTHALLFYSCCLVLGYALFRLWPEAYASLGMGDVQSAFVVVAIINLHHFIVDAFIWKLRSDPNYQTVSEA